MNRSDYKAVRPFRLRVLLLARSRAPVPRSPFPLPPSHDFFLVYRVLSCLIMFSHVLSFVITVLSCLILSLNVFQCLFTSYHVLSFQHLVLVTGVPQHASTSPMVPCGEATQTASGPCSAQYETSSVMQAAKFVFRVGE